MTRRQAMGLLLAACLVMAGRAVRTNLLVGPGGEWRDPLWLDDLLPQITAHQEEPPEPVLTDPLPINTCSEDSLRLLPGVGPALASRIMAARLAGVRFSSAADLEQIKGIGPRMSARLTSLIDCELSTTDQQ